MDLIYNSTQIGKVKLPILSRFVGTLPLFGAFCRSVPHTGKSVYKGGCRHREKKALPQREYAKTQIRFPLRERDA